MEYKNIVNEYKELKKEGKGAKSLAKKYMVDEDNIYRALAKNGCIDFLKLSKEDKIKISNLYKKGNSIKDISKITGKGFKQINYYLLYKGNLRKKTPKYKIKNDIFKVIDNEEKAYWLGFLYADGYVSKNKNHLELTIKDLDHLEKFKKFLKTDVDIKEKITKLNGKVFTNYRLTISSKEICLDLNRLGCCSNKSLTLTSPKNVPDKLSRHFIRGYFDGDGSVGIYKSKKNKLCYSLSILGTPSILNYIRKQSSTYGGLNRRKISSTKKNKAFVINYGSIKSFTQFKNFIYKDSNIYLQRKYEKFNFIDKCPL